MSQAVTNEPTNAKFGAWPSWVAIAAIAIFMGLLLPQLMPGEIVPLPAQPKAGLKDAGKLEYAAPALPEPPSVQGMLLRLATGTVIVLCLCVATLWCIRRWLHPAASNGSTPREMRLMETLQLGGRCSLHLVQLGKQPILIGMDASGIKTIVPLPTPFDDALQDATQTPVAEATIPFSKHAA